MRRFLQLLVLTVFVLSSSPRPTAVYARSGRLGFADLAEKLLPLSSIFRRRRRPTAEDFGDLPELQLPTGSPFEDFFKEFLEKQAKAPAARCASVRLRL
jgi:serine protease Do